MGMITCSAYRDTPAKSYTAIFSALRKKNYDEMDIHRTRDISILSQQLAVQIPDCDAHLLSRLHEIIPEETINLFTRYDALMQNE